MALILSSLRDGGVLSLMNKLKTLNNHARIDLPRFWLYSYVTLTDILPRHAVTAVTTIHQRWGQLQR